MNRPSDLIDKRRNSFGLLFPNHVFILGTKGDVETFFLLINDLLSQEMLKIDCTTIAEDLFRTLIDHRNLEKFKQQTVSLKEEFEKIPTNKIDWEQYPFNREYGEFDYQQSQINLNKSTLQDVFEKFFVGFEKAPYWVEKYLSKEVKDFPRIVVAPTEIVTSQKFKNYKDIDFLEAADNPLWLREPA